MRIMLPCCPALHSPVAGNRLRLSFSVLLQLWIRLLDCVFGSRTAHFHSSIRKSKVSGEVDADRLEHQCSAVLSPLAASVVAPRTGHGHLQCDRANRFSVTSSSSWPTRCVALCRTLPSRSYLVLLLLLLLSPHRCLCRLHQAKSTHRAHQPFSHFHNQAHPPPPLHSHHHHHSHSHKHHFSSSQAPPLSITIAPTDRLLESALFLQHQAHLDQTHALSQPAYLHHEVLSPKRPPELAQTKCIDRCSCKWRSGKMWVECQKAELQHVPRGLDSGTQVLVLTGNPLSELEARAFERVDLRNLQRLHLVNCRLSDINIDAFQQLSNLIELDLAGNELTTLPTSSLVHTPILRKLSLARNKIRALKNEPFAKLKHLQSIDLSGNGIELIDPNAFYGVRDLKHLYLHENNLRSIDGKTMHDLPSVLELTLQHNPWRCDCGLRAFRDWMLERDISISYSPNCSAPSRLAGKTWSALDLDEFACPPDVVRVDTEVVVYEGENASIGCVMAAIPNVHIEWEWRGRTIRNMSLMTFGRQMYLIRESSSPAGVVITGELLPTGASTDKIHSTSGGTFDLTELVQEHKAGNLVSEQHKMLLDSLIQANNVQQRQYVSSIPLEPETFQSSARAALPRTTLLTRKRRSLDATSDDTYKRTSTLYIMNALEKDSGSYICVGSNKAGTVSANITLTVLRRLEVTAAAYSGEEVAGIVLGTLSVLLLTFFAICIVVLKSKNGSNCRASGAGTSVCSGSGARHQANGCSQTGVQAHTVLNGGGPPATNNGIGRLPNGNAQISPGGLCNGGGTLRRLSNTSTDTKDSKVSSSNLLISSNGSASNSTANTNTNSGSMSKSYVGLVPNGHGEERKGALTIRTNQLAEQIELCNYGEQTEKDNLDTLNQAAFNEHSIYGTDVPSSDSFSKMQPAPGHYFCEDTNFGSMLNDNMANSPYIANYAGRHYSSSGSRSSPIANVSNHQPTHHFGGTGSHYPLLTSNHTTDSSVDHYHAHPSCSGPINGHSPSPVHYGNATSNSAPLKPLSSLANNNNSTSANPNYFGLDHYGPGHFGSVGQSGDMPPQSFSSSARLQSHDHEFNKRRAAASVAEELQQRMAAAGVNCGETKITKANIELPPIENHHAPSGQVVQFANSATIYNYSRDSPSALVSISAKQASPALNRVRSGAMALDARDSPDEGLGEEM